MKSRSSSTFSFLNSRLWSHSRYLLLSTKKIKKNSCFIVQSMILLSEDFFLSPINVQDLLQINQLFFSSLQPILVSKRVFSHSSTEFFLLGFPFLFLSWYPTTASHMLPSNRGCYQQEVENFLVSKLR